MSPTDDDTGAGGAAPRQHVVRVRGTRRAKLTPAPGTDPSPEAPVTGAETTDAPAVPVRAAEASGPNDERLRRDVPPHY